MLFVSAIILGSFDWQFLVGCKNSLSSAGIELVAVIVGFAGGNKDPHVSSPTQPSTVNFLAFWYAFTAACVTGPYLPSILPR